MFPSQNHSLEQHDPEMAKLLNAEIDRQFRGLELIASENLTSRAVLQCLGSFLTNKYAEGEVGQRYYGGTHVVDQVETLAKQRSLLAFNLDPAKWAVNVQPYSGSPANFAVYTALLTPGDRFMGLELQSGGHLTHGFYTPKKKINCSSIFFQPFPYTTDITGTINYAQLETIATTYLPKLIIMGASAYTKDYDYARVRALCDKIGALLVMDMAHTAGLIASGCLKSPFEHCDIVTTTTHKSLRGPRSGMIFMRKFSYTDPTKETDFESRINQAVFPGLQGGPHMHQIAAVATQMKEVASPEFKIYSQQVIINAKHLAAKMMQGGEALVGSGTENHTIMWDLTQHDLTGSKVEFILESISISANKNTIPGDKSALNPHGIRIGTGAITSRGMKEADIEQVADFLLKGLALTKKIQSATEGKLLKDFKAAALKFDGDITSLRQEVEKFSTKFLLPGLENQPTA